MAVVVTEEQIAEIVTRLKNYHPERCESIKYLRRVPIGEIDRKVLEDDGDKNRSTILKIIHELNLFKNLSDEERAATRYYINDGVRDWVSDEIRSENAEKSNRGGAR